MDTLTTSESTRNERGMAPASFLVALLAAGAGALAWGAVSYFTGYEVGYVAWAIGGLVGLAMARFGGRGTTCAITAAVLTVAGIAGGKLVGTRFVVEKEFSQGCEATFTRELHTELVRDAADFADLGDGAGDEELRRFVVEHDFTSASSPEEVPEEELQTFLDHTAPKLLELHSKRTSYADWYAQEVDESRRAFEAEFSIVQANVDELDLVDVVFLLLGVSTAFGIVRKASDAAAAGEQEARKAA